MMARFVVTDLNRLRLRPLAVPCQLWGPLLSIVLLLLCSNKLQAIPLTEYHRNLQQAITALDTLDQADEEESESAYQNRVTETLVAIRNAIPQNQTVQAGDEICNVNNSWLHQQL